MGSDNSMDSCLIGTQENSANTDSICEGMERSNPDPAFSDPYFGPNVFKVPDLKKYIRLTKIVGAD
jgi:hypothetical protein